MIKDFEPRIYQQTIFNTCIRNNALVVLPTGLGKTAIAMMLAAKRLSDYPKSKIIFLAPTKPLAQQHMRTFQKHLQIKDERMALFTGSTSPDKRKELWKEVQLIFSTPQSIENDVISSNIDLSEVSLMIFDEAHRATAGYSYVFLAEQYVKRAKNPKILALTASPGHSKEKIDEITSNLFIDAIEARDDESPDVKPYVKENEVVFKEVKLSEPFKEIKDLLKTLHNKILNDVKRFSGIKSLYKKTDILKAQGEIRKRISEGEKTPELFQTISFLARLIKVDHAIELLESQGVFQLKIYMDGIFGGSQKSKAVKALIEDKFFVNAYKRVNALYEAGVEHPKMKLLEKMVSKRLENFDAKLIVFTQFRDSAERINEMINGIKVGSSKIFVGQTKKNGVGMTQKQQKKIISQFSEGEFNVLVSTSVGEEGIDIPSVDLVVFYEPVPSAIRHIQRKGRTGRHSKGNVLIFVTKGTREEGYRWSSHHKRRKMKSHIEKIQNGFEIKNNKKITDFQNKNKTNNKKNKDDNSFKIVIDYREKNSAIAKHLINKGMDISLQQLDEGDYVVSSDCVVEFKTVKDFVDSIVDKRILTQLRNLKKKYSRPIILIQGDDDIYSQRNIHPNAVRGMIATIMTSFGIPLFQTKNPKETAELIYSIAKHEQESDKYFSIERTSTPKSLKEQQEFIVSSLPDVGPSLAKRLLLHFASVENIFKASLDELKEVEGVGSIKAKKIFEVIREKYLI